MDVRILQRIHNIVRRQLMGSYCRAKEKLGFLIFGLGFLRAVENKCWLFKTPRLWYQIMVVPETSAWSIFIVKFHQFHVC